MTRNILSDGSGANTEALQERACQFALSCVANRARALHRLDSVVFPVLVKWWATLQLLFRQHHAQVLTTSLFLDARSTSCRS
jgi:hypothetical protein